jgi:hypothetical protein
MSSRSTLDLDTLQTENLLRDGASEIGRKEEAFRHLQRMGVYLYAY